METVEVVETGEDTKIEIVQVTDKEEMLSFWPLIKKTTLCDQGDHINILSACLEGRFMLSKGVVDKKVIGIIVYYPLPDGSCFVSIMQGEHYLKLFKDLFYKTCRDAGYKRVLTSTSIEEAPYVRLTGLKKIYSVYEYDLTQKES